jgi:hypothetical protein
MMQGEGDEVTATVEGGRAHLLAHGYCIVRECVPHHLLERLRAEYEELVGVQRKLWAEAAGGDESAGTWGTAPQPRLNIANPPLVHHLGPSTIGTCEFWTHPNMHRVSSDLLGVEDAAATELMCMCNPVRDHDTERDWNGWHSQGP